MKLWIASIFGSPFAGSVAKSCVTAVVLVAVFGIVCFCGVVPLAVRWYDYLAERLANRLYDYPLPADSVVVSRELRVHKLENGNTCMYGATQTVYSTAPVHEIGAHYADAQVEAEQGLLDPSIRGRRLHHSIFLRYEGARDALPGVFYTISLMVVSETLDPRCH